MKVGKLTRILIIAIVLQFGQRPALTPAETLLEPAVLRAIERGSVEGPAVPVLTGSNAAAGEIVLACEARHCEAVEWAMKRIVNSAIPKPSRTIRLVSTADAPPNTKAVIFIARSRGTHFQIIRGLWSTAGIADEVVEVFGRYALEALNVRSYEYVFQPRGRNVVSP